MFHRARNILVTTTSELQNYEIKRYIGLISARAVAGTWFFSDFLASVSDTFGSRSGTYQKQLKRINEEVINELKDEARRVGANAVLGIKIDNDEISGKTKQMFMVTAIGTAVIVKEKQESFSEQTQAISAEQFDIESKKHALIKTIQSYARRLPSEVEWNFLSENKVDELADDLLNKLENLPAVDIDIYRNRLINYFSNLDTEITKTVVYNHLEKGSKNIQLCFDILSKVSLLDYDWVLKLLSSTNTDVRQTALLTLKQCGKQLYVKDDIVKLQTIRDKVLNGFPNLGKIQEGDKWLCVCGKENKSNQLYCKSCKKDIRGFTESNPKPEGIIKLIDSQLEVLQKVLV